MSKWEPIDPADIKVGDKVRMVDAFSMFQISGKTSPSKIGISVGGIDFTEAPECRTWFVRKPKKAKPLTRPDEPPVGTFFRVDRNGSGNSYRRVENPLNPNVTLYISFSTPGVTLHWEDITEPGDTWTLLELREVGK